LGRFRRACTSAAMDGSLSGVALCGACSPMRL
jgi:hypothetical protein